MQRHGQGTFHKILMQVASKNVNRLIDRARIANRLAKSVTGEARSIAYRVKTNALVALTHRFPEQVNISNDPCLPQFVIVTVIAARFGLHAPVEQFMQRR